MIDAGQACRVRARRSSTWQRVAVPVVPTIDAGKLVIGLASAGAFPRPCPCRRSTPGGKGGHRLAVPPVVPMIDAGQACRVRASRSSTWQRVAVPVVPTIDAGVTQAGHRPGKRRGLPAAVPVPMIDAGQFQGQADGGQGGHRPGKRRGLAAAVPVCRRSTPGSVPSPGKLVIDLASAGAFPRPCPWCR